MTLGHPNRHKQLAAGRCVLVILSAEYLRSPFCMTELHGIWRAAGERDAGFRRRIVPLVQDDLSLRSLPDRVAHLEHWRRECARLEDVLSNYSKTDALRLLGPEGVAEWQAITAFHQDIVKMLGIANDMLIPRQPELLAADNFTAVRELIRERIA